MMLMVSEKGIVELVVEEGTMKFAGRKVGTLKSSKSKDRNGAGLGRVPPILFPAQTRVGALCFFPYPSTKKSHNPVPAPPRVTVKALTIATLQCNSNLNLTLNEPSRFQNKKSEYFPSQADQIHKISMTHPS